MPYQPFDRTFSSINGYDLLLYRSEWLAVSDWDNLRALAYVTVLISQTLTSSNLVGIFSCRGIQRRRSTFITHPKHIPYIIRSVLRVSVRVRGSYSSQCNPGNRTLAHQFFLKRSVCCQSSLKFVVPPSGQWHLSEWSLQGAHFSYDGIWDVYGSH